ncbi:MAG: hypothetical protein ACRDL5_02420 [Solirubrobacteraceae bacterium]
MFTHKPSTPISSRVTVCLFACVMLAVAGCGGSSKHGATSSHTRAGATSAAAQKPTGSPPAALAGVRGRVLRAGEMKGFSPQGRRLLGINPQSWVAEAVGASLSDAQQAAEIALLQREGFVAAVSENLSATLSAGGGDVPGLSIVEQFRSPGGARAELSANIRQDKAGPSPGARFEPFPVSRIPAARGFGYSGTSAANVAFTKGSYYYLVGAGGSPSGSGSARALVIAAARHLYHRVAQ